MYFLLLEALKHIACNFLVDSGERERKKGEEGGSEVKREEKRGEERRERRDRRIGGRSRDVRDKGTS